MCGFWKTNNSDQVRLLHSSVHPPYQSAPAGTELGEKGGKFLTDDVGEQQGKCDGDCAGAEGCALPVTAAVRFTEGEQRPGHGGSWQRPRGRRVDSAGSQRVVLIGCVEECRRAGAVLEKEVPGKT